jgi:hypothetical protein
MRKLHCLPVSIALIEQGACALITGLISPTSLLIILPISSVIAGSKAGYVGFFAVPGLAGIGCRR